MPRSDTPPATMTEAWNKAIEFMQTRTLLWSTDRVMAACNDPVVKMLHREINYMWGKDAPGAGIRVIRNWCKAFLIAGKEWKP